MGGKQQRDVRSKLRWTLGSLIVIVAVSAVGMVLRRPFVSPAPPSGEIISVSFDIQKTQTADGRTVLGGVPRITVTGRVNGKVSPAKPQLRPAPAH